MKVTNTQIILKTHELERKNGIAERELIQAIQENKEPIEDICKYLNVVYISNIIIEIISEGE